MNTQPSSIGAALTAAVLTSVLAGCSSSDKPPAAAATGYAGKPVTLTIGTDDSPGVPSADQITHFADAVAQLSDGKVTIEPRWHAEGDDHPFDWDQAVASMVGSGELDLAVGPTWAWDTLGVTSLEPLQAPFLVDSDELVAQVVSDEDLAGQLMSAMPDAGVTGIAMRPEGLRHPFGFQKPLTKPEHYADQVIRSAKSDATAQIFAALGAKVSAHEPDATTMAGSQAEFVLGPNGIGVANVTFFPKVNVLYANADSYAGLDDAAVRVLAQAAGDTQKWAIDQADDATAGQAFCADGGTVVMATEEDVKSLQEATSPVVASLAAAQGNQDAIDAIEDLKSSVAAVETAAACSGQEITEHKPGKAEAALNGTYRFEHTHQDFLDAGYPASEAFHNAGVQTFVLEDGKVHIRLDPSEHEFNEDPVGPDEADGTYQVDDNAVTFRFPVYDNEIDRMLFEVTNDGDLTMTPLAPDPEAGFLIT